MAFDFRIHIAENSQQAQVIQDLAAEQHITPEEAAQRVFNEGLNLHTKPTPIQQTWGALSSPAEIAMLDDIVAEAYEQRLANPPRDFGL